MCIKKEKKGEKDREVGGAEGEGRRVTGVAEELGRVLGQIWLKTLCTCINYHNETHRYVQPMLANEKFKFYNTMKSNC